MARYSSLSSEDLVSVCAGSRDSAAWQEFIRRFQPLIATVVLRMARRWGDPPGQLVDDLVQETYLKLCADDSRLLRSFQAHHADAIYGFLKVVAANVVHDHFKAALAGKRGAGRVDVLESEEARPSTALSSVSGAAEMERRILLQQVDDLLTRVATGDEKERNRAIFWLYYRNGLSASDIASLPSIGLSTKGVESTILRMTRMIRSHLLEAGVAGRHPADAEGFGRAKSF